MEIEAKFCIDDANAHIFTLLPTLPTLGRYSLRAEHAIAHQRNIYYDTLDGRLHAAQYGLRIRHVNGGEHCAIVTLKGPNQAHEGIHQRAEWDIESDNPNPSTWPPGEAREHALALLGDALLHPIVTIYTDRRQIIATYNSQDVAECSLDEGYFEAGGRTQRFRELEIELLPDGTHADLDALITAIQAHGSLIPENRSKLQRAMDLLVDDGDVACNVSTK